MPTEFPLSDVVTVSITRQTLFPTLFGFGTITIVGTTDVIDHGERVRFYSNITEVTADFASIDEEHIAASAGFAQNPAPTRIGIGRALTASAAGFMRGGAAGTPATFAAVSDGTFTISIDGDPQDITAVDFTGDVTLAVVAATLQVALRAIGTGGYTLCVVSENPTGRLQIDSGTTGATSTVSALTPEGTGTDLSGAGFINALSSVAVIVNGHTFVDLTGELDAIEARNDDWYGLALTRDLKTVANYEAAASWAESRKKILAAFDDSLIALDPLSVLDLPFLLKAAGYQRTFCHWSADSTQYPEVSALARLATVDYATPGVAITLKFKQLPGITAVSISTSERNALIGKNAQIYVNRGNVTMLEEGVQSGGEFTDIIHGADWIEDTMAIGVFGELYTAVNKVAMTDSGVARLQSKVKEVLDQAVAAELIAEDFDDNDQLQPAYTISTVAILAHPQAQRALRVGPPITFDGRWAGAIHSQAITGIVTV